MRYIHNGAHSVGLGLVCQEVSVHPVAQTAGQNAQVAVHRANRELQYESETTQCSAQDDTTAIVSPAMMTSLPRRW